MECAELSFIPVPSAQKRIHLVAEVESNVAKTACDFLEIQIRSLKRRTHHVLSLKLPNSTLAMLYPAILNFVMTLRMLEAFKQTEQLDSLQ